MREGDSVLAGIVTAVAGRCAVESIPWTLERLEQIGRMLRARSLGLAMLSPREASRPARLLDAVRVVADLIREPGRLEEVRQEDVGPILMVIAGLETALAARLMVAGRYGVENPAAEPVVDRLLTAQEAAQVLGVAADYLYRHARTLPFTVRPTPGTLRFSADEIARYIRRKQAKSVQLRALC